MLLHDQIGCYPVVRQQMGATQRATCHDGAVPVNGHHASQGGAMGSSVAAVTEDDKQMMVCGSDGVEEGYRRQCLDQQGVGVVEKVRDGRALSTMHYFGWIPLLLVLPIPT